MIIHQPEIIHRGTHTLAWSKITFDEPRQNFPEYLWYRVPSKYDDYLATGSDAFLIPGLLAGMHFGEDIHVLGRVSPRLVYNIDEAQVLLSLRFPRYLQRVKISFNRVDPLKKQLCRIGMAFSGGVDSLFTLWKHLPENQPDPDYQITDAVFIKGFDIYHHESKYYHYLYDAYKTHLAKINVGLIPLETNIVSILHNRMPFPYLFGPSIVGAGVVLSGGFTRYFVPSSWDHHKLMKNSYASDPWIDTLFSTDSTRVIHHGATHRRVEKVVEIADWDIAQKVLWVCTEAYLDRDAWNCSRCEKCFRTMIPLYSLGKLESYRTFAKPIRTNPDGLWWARKFNLRQDYASEIFPFVKMNKPDFLPWLRLGFILGMVRYWLVEYAPEFIRIWFRRFGYFVLRNEGSNSYELPEVVQLIKEFDDHTST